MSIRWSAMGRRRATLAAAWLVAASSIAWLDPDQPVRDANRLYSDGKYEEAAAAYNAALVDKPDSAALHFNLGDATYKQGKYEDAAAAFKKVETAGDPERGARVAYNVGNATFRQGQALEQTEPQKALTLYAEAVASYRRALATSPSDEDSKFNHEMVTKKIEELKKRLEEQRKEQEQQKQDQQQEGDQQKDEAQQKQDQQQQDQQQPQDQQQAGEDQQQEPQKQEGGEEQPQPQENAEDGQQKQQEEEQQKQAEQQQQGGEQEGAEGGEQDQPPSGGANGEAVAGDEKEGELSKGEAAAILDSQRGEEVSPEDVIKKLQGARVAEPAEDW